MTIYKAIIGIAALMLIAASSAAQQPVSQTVVMTVNGKSLGQNEIDRLRALYGDVYSGDYWYDAISGLYGRIDGAPIGQLHPGLRIGGALSAGASGGGDGRLTGVFINGREAHPLEFRFYKRLFGTVRPGRYWLNALGIGGFEKMPASFNLRQAIAQSQRRQREGSLYMDWIGGKPGTHVGRASDGCLYISQGNYSSDSC